MNILWIKDGKTGHEKQVKTLLDELSKTNSISIINEDYLGGLGKFFNWPHSFINFLTLNVIREALDMIDITKHDNRNSKSRKEILNKYDIDMIIGAGHATHSRILYLKKFFNYFKPDHKVKAVSVLSPTFRKTSFDVICAPLHDKNKFKAIDTNVLYFEGSLSKVYDSLPDEKIGFIGVGGKNSHFLFNDQEIYEQIKYVISLYPNKMWYIFNSRRTSAKLNDLIRNIEYTNCIFVKTDSMDTSYDEIIEKASLKFVTQDSVNMVYESLSSRGETLLFNMDYQKKDKVVKQIHDLLINKNVGYIDISDLMQGQSKKIIKSMKIIKQPNQVLFSEVEKLAFKLDKILHNG